MSKQEVHFMQKVVLAYVGKEEDGTFFLIPGGKSEIQAALIMALNEGQVDDALYHLILAIGLFVEEGKEALADSVIDAMLELTTILHEAGVDVSGKLKAMEKSAGKFAKFAGERIRPQLNKKAPRSAVKAEDLIPTHLRNV